MAWEIKCWCAKNHPSRIWQKLRKVGQDISEENTCSRGWKEGTRFIRAVLGKGDDVETITKPKTAFLTIPLWPECFNRVSIQKCESWVEILPDKISISNSFLFYCWIYSAPFWCSITGMIDPKSMRSRNPLSEWDLISILTLFCLKTVPWLF